MGLFVWQRTFVADKMANSFGSVWMRYTYKYMAVGIDISVPDEDTKSVRHQFMVQTLRINYMRERILFDSFIVSEISSYNANGSNPSTYQYEEYLEFKWNAFVPLNSMFSVHSNTYDPWWAMQICRRDESGGGGGGGSKPHTTPPLHLPNDWFINCCECFAIRISCSRLLVVGDDWNVMSNSNCINVNCMRNASASIVANTVVMRLNFTPIEKFKPNWIAWQNRAITMFCLISIENNNNDRHGVENHRKSPNHT